MNGDIPKQFRNGAAPLQTNRYSEEMILKQNQEHDSKYGFSMDCQTVYTNTHRLPESYFGKLCDLWRQP